MVNKAAKPHKRRKPLTTFSKAGYNQAGKKAVKDREGYVWTHVMTADESEAKRIELFYKRAKKDFKIEKSSKGYEIFVRRE